MAHLSSEDFTRLQNQLLELREKNYSLEDNLRKSIKELTDTRTRLHNLEEENGRYQTLIRTSKKVSEVELLVRDNGYLRNKLKDQEEDFRLQNNTLLKELSKLVGENERYERQVEVLCGNRSCDPAAEGDHGCTDDSKEVIRLRGELTEMEKRLYEAENRIETEGQAHTEKVSALSLQVTQLTNILQTHSIPVDEGEISLGTGGVTFKKLSLQDDDGLEADLDGTSETLQHYQEKSSQLQCEVERAQEQLKEEKELTLSLTSEKTRLEESLRSATEKLAEVAAQVEENCEAEQRHQEEAEARVKDMEAHYRTKLKEMESSLEEAKNSLTETNSHLAEKSKQSEGFLESIQQLEEKVKSTEQSLQQAQDAVLQKEQDCRVLHDRASHLTEEVSQMLKQKEHLEKEKGELEHTIDGQSQELTSQRASLLENAQLAESRRNLIEEMKIHLEEEKQKHKQELEKVSILHGEEIASLSSQNQHMKNKLQEINQKVSEVADLNERVLQLEQEKINLKESNDKLLEDVEFAKRRVQEETEKVATEKDQEAEKMKNEWNKERADLQTQLEISTIQRQEAEETVETLKRKVADGEEEQRIHERKGVTLMKDLKKQLVGERKRADRLQEKLSQLLTDPAQLTAIATMSEVGDDVSSVSSWSLVSGEPRDSSTRENSIIASPQGSPPPGVVTEETASLVNRLTELQQQKWQLEERITHLESSSAAMADDLLKKSAIIQHYCMEQKNIESTGSTPSSPVHHPALGDKLNVRRVLEMMRGGGGEESLREINRRLQSLLEETLGKNLQLHQDVENLSQQVHQLSKLAAVRTETESSGGLGVN